MVIEDRPKTKAHFEAVVKISSVSKLLPDEIIEYLKMAFDCQLTSPLMYSQEKDQFFLYTTVTKRRG